MIPKRYEIILADPPWGGYTNFGTAKIQYPTMTNSELLDLPWEEWMADRCVLFFWVTGPMLFRGENSQAKFLEALAEKYSLTYQGMPYVWVKTTDAGAPIGAAGPRPRLVKPTTEFVVAYSNVSVGRPLPLLTESQRQVIFAPKDRMHSRKPLAVHDAIVELLGDRPRIELFARTRVPCWDAWGNEVP